MGSLVPIPEIDGDVDTVGDTVDVPDGVTDRVNVGEGVGTNPNT